MKSDDLAKATGLIPCSVVLLTVAAGEHRDAMTATAVFVSEDPPLVTVSVAKHIVSHDLIERAGEFTLNVAAVEQVDLARQLGSTHGDGVDKFDRFAVRTEAASRVGAPVIEGSYAALECKVITAFSAATYAVYLAEVVASRSDPSRRPIVWLGGKFVPLRESS